MHGQMSSHTHNDVKYKDPESQHNSQKSYNQKEIKRPLPMNEESNEGDLNDTSNGKINSRADDKTPYRQKGRLLYFLQGLCRKKQMDKSEEKNIEIQIILQELVIYIIFLTVVMIVTFGMTSSTMYWFTKILTNLFVETPFTVEEGENNFRGSTQISHFWAFAESVMVTSLYWDFWYDNDDPVESVSEEDRNILYENKLLGVPRLRQVKVRNDSCIVHEDFRRTFTTCYDFYSYEAEDKEPFGSAHGTAWRYSTEEELNGYSYWGLLTTYSGGGYYVDLSLDRNESLQRIEELKQNLWVTRGTRAIFFDFSVYNANINLFCIAKMLFEIPPTGGIIPSYTFRTVKLLRYVTPFDYFVLVCEFIFVVFIIFYTVEEIWEMQVFRLRYLLSLWNILDLIILVLAYVLIAFSIYRYAIIRPMLTDLLKVQMFANFEFLSFWQVQYNNAIAVLVFLVWIKVFKYVRFNKTMSQLSMTLSRCAKDIAGFAIMFCIVFFAFAQLGYLLFGTQVEDFRTFGTSIFTLLRTILGDFNYRAIEEANRVLGPIFFIFYIFFVFFILLNMFLAIINDTYSEVKSEISSEPPLAIYEYIAEWCRKLLSKLGCKVASRRKPDDDKLTRNEIREALKKRNFTDLEIAMFFAKYDIDEDKPIEEEHTRRMLTDLEGRRVSITPSPGISSVSQKELTVLQKRLNHMENTMTAVVEKVETVLDKLDALERSRQRGNRKDFREH